MAVLFQHLLHKPCVSEEKSQALGSIQPEAKEAMGLSGLA